MASPRIEYAVLPAGEGPGQDRCFTADGLVVVLDGASAIDPEANPDATEYVDTLGPLLIEKITGTPGIDLRDALAGAIRQTAEKLALVAGTAPSSTVSVVRWGVETVDVLVLGDSPVIVQFTDGGQETIVQHPQEHIAAELRQRYRARLTAGYGFDSEHRRLLREIQRAESAARNRAGGFWIAEAAGEASRWSSIRRYSSSEVALTVLATDGVIELEALLPRIAENESVDLFGLLERAREWEAQRDPKGQLRPRSKIHDDKTIARVVSVRYDRGI